MPVGKRPRPKVAGSRGTNQWSGPGISRYKGTSENKSPTGNRPVPRVPRHTPRPESKAADGSRGNRAMSMPAPKRRATTGRSKRLGGG